MTLAAVLPVLLLPVAEAEDNEKAESLTNASAKPTSVYLGPGCKGHRHSRKFNRRGIRKSLLAGKPAKHWIVCARSRHSVSKLRSYHRRYRKTITPRGYARWLLRNQPGQFSCLDQLVMRESHWDVHATNPSSGAYGIPQALPGYKMASAGPDWRTNGRTQVRWMLTYIRGRYGTPCGALSHSHSTGWY